MKTRHGFVSNSSSSSFVILGAIIDPEKPDDLYEKAEANNIAFYHLHDGKYVVGQRLAQVEDSGDIADTNNTLQELAFVAEEVKDKVKDVLGLDIEPALLTGTYAC